MSKALFLFLMNITFAIKSLKFFSHIPNNFMPKNSRDEVKSRLRLHELCIFKSAYNKTMSINLPFWQLSNMKCNSCQCLDRVTEFRLHKKSQNIFTNTYKMYIIDL